MVVRGTDVPARAAAARPVPAIHADRRRGARVARAAHRRRADRDARPLAARAGDPVRDAREHAGGRQVPPGVPVSAAGVLARARGGAVRGMPEAHRDESNSSAGLQEPRLPACGGRRADDGTVPLRRMSRALHGGPWGAGQARGRPRRQPEVGPRARLLHAHYVRSDCHQRPGIAEHGRGWRPLRRPRA